MWTCAGCYCWIIYDFYGSGYMLVKGSTLREYAILSILASASNLEPLNIFLYTWRFLATLECEEEHLPTKKALRWYATLTGGTIPLLYYCFYVAVGITNTYYNTYSVEGNADKAAYWLGILVEL
jgi:hypothetical protein